jgi:hypothetical protein
MCSWKRVNGPYPVPHESILQLCTLFLWQSTLVVSYPSKVSRANLHTDSSYFPHVKCMSYPSHPLQFDHSSNMCRRARECLYVQRHNGHAGNISIKYLHRTSYRPVQQLTWGQQLPSDYRLISEFSCTRRSQQWQMLPKRLFPSSPFLIC